MRFFIALLFTLTLNATISEDINHFLAQKAYRDKDYKKSLNLYKKLPQSSDIKFEIAQNLYRLKRFKEAIAYFKSVYKPELNGAINYNIANCYYKLEEYANAKKFYKNALKFKDVKELAKKGLKLTKAKITITAKIRVKQCKDVMLGLGDLSATLDEFIDPFVSKDLTLAKLKEKEKSNVLSNANLTTRDEEIDGFELNSSKKSTKIYNLNELKSKRLDKSLKEIESKTLLIPIGESK